MITQNKSWMNRRPCRAHHRILLHDLPVFVDGPSFLAATQGYTTIPAAGLLACRLGPFEGFFGISKIVRDHGGKAMEQPCHFSSKGTRPIRIVYFYSVPPSIPPENSESFLRLLENIHPKEEIADCLAEGLNAMEYSKKGLEALKKLRE